MLKKLFLVCIVLSLLVITTFSSVSIPTHKVFCATGVFADGGSANTYFAEHYAGVRATGIFAKGGSAQKYFEEHHDDCGDS